MRLSVNKASQILGWGQGQLQRRVDGRSKFTIDDLDQIEKVLGISAAYLLGYTDHRTTERVWPAADVTFLEPKSRTTDYKGEGSVVDFTQGGEDDSPKPEAVSNHRPLECVIYPFPGVYSTDYDATPATDVDMGVLISGPWSA